MSLTIVSYQTVRDQGLTRTFTCSNSRGLPCMQCQCFNVAGVIYYFLGKRLSKLTVTNISNLKKNWVILDYFLILCKLFVCYWTFCGIFERLFLDYSRLFADYLSEYSDYFRLFFGLSFVRLFLGYLSCILPFSYDQYWRMALKLTH